MPVPVILGGVHTMPDALKNRLWIGIGLLLLLCATIYAGPTAFVGFVLIMMVLAGFEWGKLSGLSRDASFVYAAIVGILSIVPTGFAGASYMSYVVLVSIFLMLWHRRWTILTGVLVLPYIFLTLMGLMSIADKQYGIWWVIIMYVWAMVIIMDVGAYVVGKKYGKNLLWRRISPGKTWEGFFGGLICTMGASVVFYMWGADIFGVQNIGLWMVGTAVIALFAQLGDLCESHMKRRAGVKDSGILLQQHGGVLDRIDGLIGALIIIRICIELGILRGILQ